MPAEESLKLRLTLKLAVVPAYFRLKLIRFYAVQIRSTSIKCMIRGEKTHRGNYHMSICELNEVSVFNFAVSMPRGPHTFPISKGM